MKPGKKPLFTTLVFALIIFVIFAQSFAQSNDSKTVIAPRKRLLMDSQWLFFKGDEPGAEKADFNDADWRKLDIPHDWSIEGPFGEKEPSGGNGGYVPTGIGWYRKSFRLPDSYKDKRIAIEFDGVYENSEVWVNGQYLGKRPFGYISFHYDITPHLNFGSRENVIAVKVDNSKQRNSRWYSGSGIYRHAWLLVTGDIHIAHWGTFVITPKVSQTSSLVRVKTMVRNEGKVAANCTLTTDIIDKNGKVVEAVQGGADVAANGEHELTQELTIENPNLWSADSPYLYTAHSSVRIGDKLVDEYDTPFGIREVVFDADKGCLLNGRQIKLNGVCLHHEGGSVGAAVPERVWERRLEILKEMGCNAIRTAHNPPAPEFLDLCDRMGFLVMDEAFDEWKVHKFNIEPYGYSLYFDEWSERDVKSFVRRDRNHPSVVLWSAGNEVGDQTDPNGVQTLKRLVEIFHREDPTRLVTVGCDMISAEPKGTPKEFLELLDVVGYNYVARWRERAEKYYSIDRHAFPQRKVIGTENPSMGGLRGDYRGLFPGTGEGGSFRRRGLSQMITVEQLWKFTSTYDYVAGDFMWTGIDYLGESQWPSRSSSAGVLDTAGFKKDGFYFYQSQWTNKPVLHVFPHWNWKGKEGQVIPITCFTNCDTVELFLNGKSFGVKGYVFPLPGVESRNGEWYYAPRARVSRTTADLHLSWDVPYEPGTLKAVGTRDGNVVSTMEIVTAGEPAAIGLSVDRSTIVADGRDVAHIMIQILDVKGHIVPTADNDVAFEIQGEGKIIGVDSGKPDSHESFQADHRKAFNGLCLAIVQAKSKPGKIRLTARAAGLKEDSIEIEIKSPTIAIPVLP
jgi:beta-galactosidase